MKALVAKDSHRVSRPQRAQRHATLTDGDRVQRANVRNILNNGDVQAKLTIGQPNDSYEQEADRVADHVVAGQPAPGISAISSPSSLARKADDQATEPQAAANDELAEEQKGPEEESGLYLLQPTMAAGAADGEDDESVQPKLIQRQAEEEEEPVQAKLIQRQAAEEEEPVQAKLIQREAKEEDEPVQAKLIQRQAAEEEEPVQAKLIQREVAEEEEPVQAKLIQKQEEEEDQQVQAKASAAAASAAVASKSGGSPMRPDVRGKLEASMGTDLSEVRVHEGGSASAAAKSINARAFTHQNDIWLGAGESQSDLHLMAHETTHVLQQGGVARRKPVDISQVEPRVQRWWNPIDALGNAANVVSNAVGSAVEFVGDAAGNVLGFIRDKALEFVQEIPGYSLFTVVLGRDPITDQAVARNGRNFIEAGLDIIPNGGELKQKLQENGKLEEAAAWLDEQINVLDIDPASLARQLGQFWDSLGAGDLMDPGGALSRLLAIVRGPIERILRFAMELAAVFLKFIKDALVSRLVEYARTIRGYPLLTVILGKDPFSEEPVERSTENIIHGFMSLMDGGEEQFQEMKQTGAIERMSTRIEVALAALNFTWEFIRGLFVTAWESFGLPDLANPFDAFQRVVALFTEPISRLFNFVVAVIRMVIEVALQLMHFPITLISNIITKSMQAIDNIKRDPIGFLKNLLRAVKTGFVKFFDNIVQHLINGVTGWLFGQLEDAGITPPPDLSFQSILGLVMQILGITMDKIFKKLAEKIGQEKVDKIKGMMDKLTGIWAFVSDVMTRGPVAIWEYIQEKLSDLWGIVLESVRNWVITKIVTQVTAKLLSMLDPTGIMAVVNGFIAFYNAVQSFIQYLTEMLQVVNSFVEGVAEIAAGSVESAANFLENAMGRAMPVIIGFLANQVGLGALGRRIGEMIERVQGMVDEGLDWLIDKAVSAGTAFLNMARSGAAAVTKRISNWWGARQSADTRDGKHHQIEFRGTGAGAELIIRSTPKPYSQYLDEVKAANSLTEDQIAPAKQKARQIEAEKSRNVPEDQKETQAQNIQGLVDELAQLTKVLPLDASTGTNTAPVYGPLRNGFGTLARVAYLESPHDHGSGPSVGNTPEFDAINLRRQGGGSYYVKGHLLNENLGGPGSTWSNLTPISQAANGAHKNEFENRVKMAVNGKKKGYSDVKVGGMREFLVQANYGRVADEGMIGRLLGTDDEISGVGDKDRADLARILRAEQYVPTSLTCSVQLQDASGSQLPPISGLPILNDIQYGQLGQYALGPSSRTRYVLAEHIDFSNEDISSATAELRQLNGIDEQRARRIYEALNQSGRIRNYVSDIGVSKAELEAANPRYRITGGTKS